MLLFFASLFFLFSFFFRRNFIRSQVVCDLFSSVFNFTNPVCTDFSFRFVAFSHSLAPFSLTHMLVFFFTIPAYYRYMYIATDCAYTVDTVAIPLINFDTGM